MSQEGKIMAQNDEKQQKSFLPTQREVSLLIQKAKNILQEVKEGKTGDPIEKYDEAISLYEQALGKVKWDSGDAAEVRSFLIQAIAEQVELLITQISTKTVPVQKLDQTFNELFNRLENLKALEQQNIQVVSTLEDQEQKLVQKEEDLEEEEQELAQKKKEVGLLLAIGHTIDTTLVTLIRVLSAMLKPLLYVTFVAMVITLASPAVLNWYFNNSPLKLCSSGKIVISVSSTLKPLVMAEAQRYQQKCSGATITINTASPDGIAQVDANPAIAIGTAETFAYTTQHQLWDNQVGIATFSLIVNKQAGVSNLTTENIREIYSGRVVNWNQVCSFKGKKEQQCGQPQSINIIGRPIDSNVRAAFEQYVLGSTEYIASPTTSDVDSLPQGNGIIQDVINTPGAIGYVTLNAAQTAHLSPISIDGVAPTAMSISSGAYKFWSIEHFYTRGAASGLTQKFTYFMHTDDAIFLLHHYGFQSMTDIPDTIIRNHVVQST
jgi:phosphate transport system substrate-binding protein